MEKYRLVIVGDENDADHVTNTIPVDLNNPFILFKEDQFYKGSPEKTILEVASDLSAVLSSGKDRKNWTRDGFDHSDYGDSYREGHVSTVSKFINICFGLSDDDIDEFLDQDDEVDLIHDVFKFLNKELMPGYYEMGCHTVISIVIEEVPKQHVMFKDTFIPEGAEIGVTFGFEGWYNQYGYITYYKKVDDEWFWWDKLNDGWDTTTFSCINEIIGNSPDHKIVWRKKR